MELSFDVLYRSSGRRPTAMKLRWADAFNGIGSYDGPTVHEYLGYGRPIVYNHSAMVGPYIINDSNTVGPFHINKWLSMGPYMIND